MIGLAARSSMALLILFASGGARAAAGDSLRSLPNRGGQTEVRIGFNLIDITSIDEKEEAIEFEASLYLMWKDERQSYDPADLGLSNRFVAGDYSNTPDLLYQGDYAVKELFHGWRPHVVMSNGSVQISDMAVGIFPDGMMFYVQTFHGKAETPMKLRRFPFDRQSLKIYFRPLAAPRKDVVLIPDRWLSGMWTRDVGIAQWGLTQLTTGEQPIELTYLDGSKGTISEYVVVIDLVRHPDHLLFSIVLPLVLLMSLTWCVFWMDEESVSNRINISFIGILSVVAYYFVVLDNVPEISYLTLMDGFILVSFFVLAASVVINLVVDKLNRAGRKSLGDRLDITCRWAFPVGYLLSTVLLVLVFFNVE